MQPDFLIKESNLLCLFCAMMCLFKLQKFFYNHSKVKTKPLYFKISLLRLGYITEALCIYELCCPKLPKLLVKTSFANFPKSLENLKIVSLRF